jgi:hypothetical protein
MVSFRHTASIPNVDGYLETMFACRERQTLLGLLDCHYHHIDTTMHYVCLLPRRYGWLKKQGHTILSWKYRYFTLYAVS